MKSIFKFFRTELILLPLVILGFVWGRDLVMSSHPDSHFYDLTSELETISFGFVQLLLVLMLAYFAFAISFPPLAKHFVERLYADFSAESSKAKTRMGMLILLSFFLGMIFLSSCSVQASEDSVRAEFVSHLYDQVGIREATGRNDGPEVEKYLAAVGLGKGYAWCAAFNAYNFDAFGIPNPQSAWSPHWAQRDDIVWSSKLRGGKIRPGDVFTWYSPRKRRVAHTGIVVGTDKHGAVLTIEGNTNDGGSRDGDGVYARKRSLDKIYAVTNYISPYYEATHSSATPIAGDEQLPNPAPNGADHGDRQYGCTGSTCTTGHERGDTRSLAIAISGPSGGLALQLRSSREPGEVAGHRYGGHANNRLLLRQPGARIYGTRTRVASVPKPKPGTPNEPNYPQPLLT